MSPQTVTLILGLSTVLATIVAAVLAARAAIGSARRTAEATQATADANAEAARVVAAGPDWKAFTQELRDEHAARLRSMDEANMATLTELRDRMSRIEQTAETATDRAVRSERISAQAVAYVTRLLDWIAEQMPDAPHPPIPMPVELRRHIENQATE